MINLIKNELFKIFKKKSTYITILVFVGLLTLLNFALSYDVNTDYNDYMYSEDNISYLTESLQELNPSNSDEVDNGSIGYVTGSGYDSKANSSWGVK